MEAVEEEGFRVLHGPTNYPFYTNWIEGLEDRFGNRNTNLNLRWYEEPEDVPVNERFHGAEPNHYFSSSTEDGSSGGIEGYFTGGEEFQEDQREGEVSDERTHRDPMDTVTLSPGRRLGLLMTHMQITWCQGGHCMCPIKKKFEVIGII